MKHRWTVILFAGLVYVAAGSWAADQQELVEAIQLREAQSEPFEAAIAEARRELAAVAKDRVAFRKQFIAMDEPFKKILEQHQWGAYLKYKEALVSEALAGAR